MYTITLYQKFPINSKVNKEEQSSVRQFMYVYTKDHSMNEWPCHLPLCREAPLGINALILSLKEHVLMDHHLQNILGCASIILQNSMRREFVMDNFCLSLSLSLSLYRHVPTLYMYNEICITQWKNARTESQYELMFWQVHVLTIENKIHNRLITIQQSKLHVFMPSVWFVWCARLTVWQGSVNGYTCIYIVFYLHVHVLQKVC